MSYVINSKRSKRTMFVNEYKQADGSKKVDYNIWKYYFIRDNKIDISENVYTSVVRGKFISITYGELFEYGAEFKDLGDKLMIISNKAILVGANLRVQYRELLDDIFSRETSELYKRF